MEVKEA